MTVSRGWPVPIGDQTIHLIGDIHFGAVLSARTDKVLADFSHQLVPAPLAHFQVGDQTQDGISSEDTTALAWLASITDAPVYVCLGNHDIMLNNRTVAAWESAYAAYLPGGSKNHVVDFDTFRVITVGPDTLVDYPTDSITMQLTQATLDWLAARLAETELDCYVLGHAPLYNTCLGGASYFQSTDAMFHMLGPNATDDTEIRTLLGAHENAKAWLSGHTHSDITVAGFATLTTCGSRQVAHINASAVYYTGVTAEWNDPLYTVYLTRTPAGAIEVRYRNHGAGVWYGPSGARVTTLTPG